METKTCHYCGLELSLDLFYKTKGDSRERKCKKCKLKIANSKYEITCQVCGKKHKTRNKETTFCSKECIGKSQRKTLIKHCDFCNKEIKRPQSQFPGTSHTYCSYDCQSKGWTKFYSGENSPVYNHEKPLEDRLIERKYVGYYEWRKSVYERDSYTCQCCGDNTGGNLAAHHILNYSEHEELRVDVGNGITLCTRCHKGFHDKYGYKNNNEKQLITYLNTQGNHEPSALETV